VEPTREPATPSPAREDDTPSFDLLNTGEFLIRTNHVTLLIPADLVPAMRAQLATIQGAFE